MNSISSEILFDKFEIISCIKRDTGSSVYIANHIYLGKKIILKTLDTNDVEDKTVLERFKREAKILAKLDHPNLIKILDYGTYENFTYLSFEYFDSKNLRKVIQENKLNLAEKKKLVVQLLHALQFAHQNNIIHRDIKPENILVNSNLELKIADFGLALIANDTILTHSSSIVGTPGYMSPEQIRGEKTPQTDIFSSGIVVYELFTGTNPIMGDDVSQTINNILNFNEKEHVDKLNSLPPELRNAIAAMLHKSLKQRAKSADEVLSYLGVGRPPGNIKKLKNLTFNRITPYAAVLVIVVTAVIFIANFSRDDNSGYFDEAISNINNYENYGSKNPSNQFNYEELNNNEIISNNQATGISENKNNSVNLLPGKLFIDCSPWATIYVDGDSVDTTPIQNFISLKPGRHKLQFAHSNFPIITKYVKILPGTFDSLRIHLNDFVGYLKCNVDPWGKVYINGEFKGITPLQPLTLLPGKYNLVVKNDSFEPLTKKIKIVAQKTNVLNLHFIEN